MHRRSPISVLVALGPAALGCGSSDLSACDELACQPWQECADGSCVAQPGRCDNYADCADDELCDDEHVCRGPTEPDAAFYESDALNRVTFEYRGLIMSADEAAGANPTLGLGEFELRFGAQVEILEESAYSYRLLLPADFPDEALRNVDVITLGVSHQLDGARDEVRYLHLNAGFPVEHFAQMLADGDFTAPLPDPGWLVVREILTSQREWDGAVFRRSCLLAEADPTAHGEIFLNSFDNESFAPGEDLRLWGNVTLTAKNEITAATEEALCLFSINGVATSRDEYLAGLAQTDPELSCEVPAGFLEPATARYATILFLGEINDASVGLANFTLGTGSLTLSLAGSEIEADDYYVVVYRYTFAATDLMIYQGVGSATQLGDDHLGYYLFRLVVDPAALVEMKANAWPSVPLSFEPNVTYVALEYTEQKVDGADTWYRICPRALMDPDGTFGALLVCHDLNVDFGSGEPYEFASAVELIDDPAVMRSLYGITEDCYCYINTSANLIGCDSFDAL